MKGLILKDILLIKNQMKTLIIILLGLCIIFSVQGNLDFIMILVPVYLLMLYITTFSYDDYNHFDTFVCTLPYTRKDVIKSKYFLLLIGSGASAILLFIMSLIMCLIDNSLNIEELISLSFGTICGIILVASIFTPFIYKFGAQKGRIALFIIIAFISALGSILMKNINVNFTLILNYIDNLNPIIIIATILVLLLIVMYITYIVSYKIYNRKEF